MRREAFKATRACVAATHPARVQRGGISRRAASAADAATTTTSLVIGRRIGRRIGRSREDGEVRAARHDDAARRRPASAASAASARLVAASCGRVQLHRRAGRQGHLARPSGDARLGEVRQSRHVGEHRARTCNQEAIKR